MSCEGKATIIALQWGATAESCFGPSFNETVQTAPPLSTDDLRRISLGALSHTEVVKMPESIPSGDDDAQRAIQALSEKLDVPEFKVLEVYKTEYRRLSAQSRIATFVSVLAMRNTRSILRDAGSVN
jgi:hypothetical protein